MSTHTLGKQLQNMTLSTKILKLKNILNKTLPNLWPSNSTSGNLKKQKQKPHTQYRKKYYTQRYSELFYNNKKLEIA